MENVAFERDKDLETFKFIVTNGMKKRCTAIEVLIFNKT